MNLQIIGHNNDLRVNATLKTARHLINKAMQQAKPDDKVLLVFVGKGEHTLINVSNKEAELKQTKTRAKRLFSYSTHLRKLLVNDYLQIELPLTNTRRGTVTRCGKMLNMRFAMVSNDKGFLIQRIS